MVIPGGPFMTLFIVLPYWWLDWYLIASGKFGKPDDCIELAFQVINFIITSPRHMIAPVICDSYAFSELFALKMSDNMVLFFVQYTASRKLTESFWKLFRNLYFKATYTSGVLI